MLLPMQVVVAAAPEVPMERAMRRPEVRAEQVMRGTAAAAGHLALK